VAEYHRSRQHESSPGNPNFAEIPPEYARVLTYGLARSQIIVQQPDTDKAQETSEKKSRGSTSRSRSKFAEVKDEWAPLHSTIVVGPTDDAVSCVSSPSI
jgi:hypothetical protein